MSRTTELQPPPPIGTNSHGVPRVGRSRVTLDSVVAAYNAGEPAEVILKLFPSLTPADLFGALHHYLTHRDTVDEGIRRRAAEAERLRTESISLGDHARLRAGWSKSPDAPANGVEVANASRAD